MFLPGGRFLPGLTRAEPEPLGSIRFKLLPGGVTASGPPTQRAPTDKFG